MTPLPLSSQRVNLSPAQYTAALDALLPAATATGEQFTELDLQQSARTAGISRNHPLYSNRQALYQELLRYAHSILWPDHATEHSIDLDTVIPGDAIRDFATMTFQRFLAHPHAVRLIVAENLFNRCNIANTLGVLEDSPVVLIIDRLLMRGHDVGAFRTGVSAEDVFVLLTALCSFPVTQGHVFQALYGMDISDEKNSQGMAHLIADATVAFLSTTMSTEQGTSYTHSSPSHVLGVSSVAASLYSSQDFYTDEDML